MPSLGADMAAGTLTRWDVKPGDHVNSGDTIGVVETDKANVEIEVFESGIVDRLIVQPGAKVPVGTPLALIRGETEAPAKAPALVRASPMARRLAREYQLDLATIAGSGPHGVVERADVERVAKQAEVRPGPAAPVPPVAPAPQPPAPQPSEGAGMRRAIAAAMTRSNREIPHYYLETHIDFSNAQRALETINLRRSVKERLLPAALLFKAVATALAEVPELNGYWIDDEPHQSERINVGMAIALRQGGLVIPAIHDADAKSLDEIMEAMRDLITRARSGSMRSSDLVDSTITVTNLGDLGVESVYGIIYPPQLALVGFGKIVERPWAENGMIGIRPILSATLAADHRATDGHRGARFLSALERYILQVQPG